MPALYSLAEEKALADAIDLVKVEASVAVANEDFAGAMSAMAKLRPAVDAFFDKVKVNDDDPKVRENRLKLLTKSAAPRARSRIFPRSRADAMDRATLAAYDKDAAAFAKDWHEQPAPVDLHDIVERLFIRGGTSCDIGCGSGREVAWLNANGFVAEGFDASDGLLAEATARYPQLKFAHAELPDLDGIAVPHFDNVLCETVIMHLDPALIAPSVAACSISSSRPGFCI